MNFKEYFTLCEDFNDYPLGVVIPNNNAFGATTVDNGPQGDQSPHSFSTELQLPEMPITAQIAYIGGFPGKQGVENRDPIVFRLSDGTQLFLTNAEFRRIKGDPQVGKTITVVFQRRPEDRTKTPSQVQSITVH